MTARVVGMKTAKKRKTVIGANVQIVDVSGQSDDVDVENIYVSFGMREFRQFSREPEGEVIGDEYGVPFRKIWAFVQNENALKKLKKKSVVVDDDVLREWDKYVDDFIDPYKIVGYKLVYRS
jgi:hypothetical protein